MTDPVADAIAPTSFKLDDFLSGIAYPVEQVTIHLDAFAANEKLKAVRFLDELELKYAKQLKDAEKKERTIGEVDEITSEDLETANNAVIEWNEKLENTSIIFHLRGMAPEIVEEITSNYFITPEDQEDPQKNRDRDNELIAKSIIKVTNNAGAADEHVFTAEEVERYRGKLLEGEFLKLVQAVAQVNLNGALFNQAVDAPFPR